MISVREPQLSRRRFDRARRRSCPRPSPAPARSASTSWPCATAGDRRAPCRRSSLPPVLARGGRGRRAAAPGRARPCPTPSRAPPGGAARAARSRFRAVRRSSAPSERPPGLGAEGVAAMPGAEEEIEDLLLGRPVSERGHDLVGVAALDRRGRIGDGHRSRAPPLRRRPASRRRQSAPSPAAMAARRADDLELRRRSVIALEHGRREVGDIADGERREGEVVVRFLEHRRRRQDHVRMPRRRVQVRDRRTPSGRAPRGGLPAGPRRESSTPGCRRSSRVREPGPLRASPSRPRASPRGARPAPRADSALDSCQRPVRKARGGRCGCSCAACGNIAPPGPIEIPRQDVERRRRARQRGCRTRSCECRSVRRRLPRGPRPARGPGATTVAAGTPVYDATRSGVKPATAAVDQVDSVDYLRERARGGEPFARRGHGRCLRAERHRCRADRHVQVGVRGRSRSPRIDDDDAPTTPPDRLEPARPVGGRCEAAVRLERIGAEEQQQVRAVDVGDRDHERVTEDEATRDVLRHLVDGRGRVDVLRPERLHERPDREGVGEVVRVRVADVDGDGVAALLRRGSRSGSGRPRRTPPPSSPRRARRRGGRAVGGGGRDRRAGRRASSPWGR